ncbi:MULTISPECIES: alpha/beta fold hydrolase [unclassified Arthrobacter]|uniref:alpha/beta fold hydrolase n=1 Tax=unclassified Arthrobacter TaxID=235627 RepID=UPI002E0C1E7C|nr:MULTISPECIES: hypothetical protein [unclassified Arthrobacter]MEC5193157.1 pimeloyl-ACP methyl ester carboxylesterase [Arthrobacter sp. MP_M4]MEC5202452.1 pimeloyl-ACP methyl ester carboxylesterase [Arthrobacter sp. MP_M7]
MAMAAYADARYTVSLVPLLQEVQIPTRLVWCREDDFQKISFARRDVREIGGSDLVEVDGKHIPTEDSPAAVARAVLDHLGTRPTLIRGHVHTRPGGRPSTGPGNFAGVGAC